MQNKMPSWLLSVLVLVLLGTTFVSAQEPNQAALVVRLENGRVESRCVSFDEPSISGYDLILRSDLEVESESSGLGTKICRVEEVGCPPGDCFCQCQGSACVYWSYWHLEEGEWRYSTAGATSFQVEPGDVEGWSWGPGAVSEAISPPLLTFADVCEGSAQPLSEQSNQPATGTEEPVNLLLYVGFGVIVLALGGALIWAQQKGASGANG